jgi:hypothetical protein
VEHELSDLKFSLLLRLRRVNRELKVFHCQLLVYVEVGGEMRRAELAQHHLLRLKDISSLEYQCQIESCNAKALLSKLHVEHRGLENLSLLYQTVRFLELL